MESFGFHTLLAILIVSICLYHGQAARYQVVGSENQTQLIQLKSQYDLLPGTVLTLPIDVPDEYIGLFGKLPPRLKSITSPNPAAIYGIIYSTPRVHFDYTFTCIY
jgi:hypothetical protein